MGAADPRLLFPPQSLYESLSKQDNTDDTQLCNLCVGFFGYIKKKRVTKLQILIYIEITYSNEPIFTNSGTSLL